VENVVVDKNDKFEDEFDFDDDFPSFDDEDEFHFDDDEDEDNGAFDFSDESADESIIEQKNETESDDTYQFEDITEPAEPLQSKPNKKFAFLAQILARIKKEEPKKLIIYGGAGFFIVIMIIFFIINSFSSSSTPTTRQKVATQQRSAKTPQQSQPNTTASQLTTIAPEQMPDFDQEQDAQSDLQAPVSQTQDTGLEARSPMSSTSDMTDNATKKIIKKLDEQSQTLQKQIDSMQAQLSQSTGKYNDLAQQIQSNDARVTNIERSIANVESQMSKVNNALQAIVAAASSETPQQRSPSLQHTAPQVSNNNDTKVTYQTASSSRTHQSNVYYIQAIIPGRAWLKNEDGQTITVTYGDAIAGLGKVNKIDAENGVVITSSGAKIMYGINEG